MHSTLATRGSWPTARFGSKTLSVARIHGSRGAMPRRNACKLAHKVERGRSLYCAADAGDGGENVKEYQKMEDDIELKKKALEEVVEHRYGEIMSSLRAGAADESLRLAPNTIDVHFRRKLQIATDTLQVGLVERDAEVRLLLLAAICGEHVLLLGPPGTAKSELGRRLSSLFSGSYFERLLTRFSVPEELFGPLSMQGLSEDKYVRQTEGYLPLANVAFIDEIFKANSAILNSLLTILNERLFDNGSERLDVPLLCLVGASNELPESEELDALYDRFLLRKEVKQVSSSNLKTLLQTAGSVTTPTSALVADEDRLSIEEMKTIQAVSFEDVAVPERILGIICDIRNYLQEECEPPILISDRRLVKSIALLKASAYTNGRADVNEYDCLLLQHVLWQKEGEGEKVRDWLLKEIGMDKGENQVNYLMTGLYKRSCQAKSGTEEQAAENVKSLISETANLRAVVVSQLADMMESDTEGTLPALQDHIWLSKEDKQRASQTLSPMMKKARVQLEDLLKDVITLEEAIKDQMEPYYLALLLPEYWKRYIRSQGDGDR